MDGGVVTVLNLPVPVSLRPRHAVLVIVVAGLARVPVLPGVRLPLGPGPGAFSALRETSKLVCNEPVKTIVATDEIPHGQVLSNTIKH